MAAVLVSLLCLLVFAAYVASRLRRYRSESDPLPYVALGSGVWRQLWR
jgi:hypothetical protein